MEISKVCHCLNQYYYETRNSYLNVYLLKIVVLFSDRENHLQAIFLPKYIVYLLSYFLSNRFFRNENQVINRFLDEKYSRRVFKILLTRRKTFQTKKFEFETIFNDKGT